MFWLFDVVVCFDLLILFRMVLWNLGWFSWIWCLRLDVWLYYCRFWFVLFVISLTCVGELRRNKVNWKCVCMCMCTIWLLWKRWELIWNMRNFNIEKVAKVWLLCRIFGSCYWILFQIGVYKCENVWSNKSSNKNIWAIVKLGGVGGGGQLLFFCSLKRILF